MQTGFRLNSRLLGVAAVTLLFIVSLFLWTLPFQKNRLPFGEGDSAWHFAIGDHISSSDKATFRLPYYVGAWYFGFNKILGPFAPEYPPSNHVNYALMQVLGGERFVPVFIFRALASFLGVFAVFFVISRLFGVLPGFLAGLGLSFSVREQLTFLFGQQPTLVALVLTPVATYAWYRYLSSFYEADSRPGGNRAYLFLTVALLASQYVLHLQGFVCSVVLMAVFAVIMAVRFRRLPLSKSNLMSYAVAALLLAAVVVPFAAIYLGTPDFSAGQSARSFSIGRLFQWGISPEQVEGSFPPAFVEFSAEYSGILLPFLFVGLLLLFLRIFLVKNNVKELFLLSWLIGAYVVIHLDVFVGVGLNRLARMLVLENYIFFSLIALSVVWLPQTLFSLLKLRNSAFVTAAKFCLAAVLVLSLVFTSGKSSYSSLSGAYGGIERITPVQAEFAADYLSKLPEKAFIYDPILKTPGYTTWRYPKLRWMLAISQRYVGRDNPADAIALPGRIADTDEVYVLFDYSDIALFASASDQNTRQLGMALANELRGVEVAMFNSTEPVYDNNNMRLYKYVWQSITNATVAAK